MSGDDAIKNHGAERRLFLRRTIAAGVILLVLVGLLLARIYYLQVAKHGYYETRSQDNRMRVEVVSPVRGLIYSRHGQLLANNQPAYQLEIVPEQVGDLDAVGVDLITIGEDGLIENFEVVMRPHKSVSALRDAMNKRVMTDARFLKFKEALS